MASNQQSLEKVSELLSEASKLLENSSNSAKSNEPSTTSTSQTSLEDTLRRAINMFRESSSSGLCRRLNRHERLRAAAGFTNTHSKKGNERAKKEPKAIEFALLRCFLEDEIEDECTNLKYDSVISSGMSMFTEEDDEKTIRKKIVESLSEKFPLLGSNDFDFVKVRHKAISQLQMGPGTEYNFPIVKKMAGQGLVSFMSK